MLNYGGGSTPTAQPAVNRRRTTGGDQRFSCSRQSVLNAIDRFVKSVDNMDATVLVPSRLRDMEVQNRRKNTAPPPGLQHQDLYSFYTMLKDVKNELLWGPSSSLGPPSLFPGAGSLTGSLSGMSSPRRPPMTMMSMTMTAGMPMGMTMGMPMGMTIGMTTPRQPSDDGLGSSTGCSSGCSDQDTDSDFESIMTDRESMIMEQTSHLSSAFRHHLHGLHAILHQLADSADYLASRYQEEIEAPMA